jgi:hypothetical protein
MYRKQKEMIEKLYDGHFMIVCKTRQTGISTIAQAYCAWLTVCFDNVIVGVISKDGKKATDFSRKVRDMITKIPDWLSPGFTKFTEQTYILKNGSSILSYTVDPKDPSKSGRGDTPSFLVVDEAGFISRVSDAWTSLVPSLSTAQMHARNSGTPYGTLIISTPNSVTGTGFWFYDMWKTSLSFLDDGKEFEHGDFYPYKIYWREIPELADDPLWYPTVCKMFKGPNRDLQIAQEMELKFIATEGTFFPPKTCDVLQENTKTITPIKSFRLLNGVVDVYEDPIPGKYYLVGVDVASLHGNDKSAITIWEYTNFEQVWEYQGKLDVTDFCKVVEYACAQYNGLIIPEVNPGSLGNQIGEFMERSPYSHMVYRFRRGEKIWRGMLTDTQTRPLMIDALYDHITSNPYCVKSERLALELVGLIKKPNGKVVGDEGCNDDLALSLSFCAYIRKYDPPLGIDMNYTMESNVSGILEMNYNADVNRVMEDLESGNTDSANARIIKMAREEASTWDNQYVDIFKYIRE